MGRAKFKDVFRQIWPRDPGRWDLVLRKIQLGISPIDNRKSQHSLQIQIDFVFPNIELGSVSRRGACSLIFKEGYRPIVRRLLVGGGGGGRLPFSTKPERSGIMGKIHSFVKKVTFNNDFRNVAILDFVSWLFCEHILVKLRKPVSL